MDTLGLSLRQKKLLHMLRGQSSFITGNELARQLNVSVRTIRNDVAGINHALAPYRAQIYSEHSKGYLYVADDPAAIQSMNQIDNAFFTRDERVRYLAFRFCLSDEPLNIYDLEDEIFVSHTTLEHDLHHLKMKYMLSEPRIRMIQQKDSLSFEADETKRRFILNQLFHADWDYHSRDNAYYGYHFLDKNMMDDIMDIIPGCLSRHGISMEDPSLVRLNLAVAIMFHRNASGHVLEGPGPKEALPALPQVQAATDDLFLALKERYGTVFSCREQEEIYALICSSRIPDLSGIRHGNADSRFDPLTVRMAQAFIRKVRQLFRLDLSEDEDFYITLLSYIRFLQQPVHIFNEQENPGLARESLLPEFEIAWVFQDLALEFLGTYLRQTELLYLAYCISGALEYLFDTHPEYKIQAVICCHLNMPAAWSLKRKILGAFEKYLNVTALLPINSKNVMDFSGVDLILSTVRKTITDHPGTDTLKIGTLLSPRDYLSISAYIKNDRMKKLCPFGAVPLGGLLQEAFWNEKARASARLEAVEELTAPLLEHGLVSPGFIQDLLRREAISSFAFRPGILFLYSLTPAQKTILSFSVFEHRILWNQFRIRVAVLAAFTEEDIPFVFQLSQIFNHPDLDPELIRSWRTREDVLSFLQDMFLSPRDGARP